MYTIPEEIEYNKRRQTDFNLLPVFPWLFRSVTVHETI